MNKIREFFKNLRMPNLNMLRGIRFPSFANVVASLRRVSIRQIVLWGGALLVTIALFVFARGLTTCWRLTALPGIPPADCPGASVNPLGTPVVDQGTAVPGAPPTPDVAAPPVQYAKWDGGSRVNIVFFGLRGGETAGEDCPLCTDTIIVFTMDPVSKTAGMISVPRDLWVNIPGSSGCSEANDGFCRINTAWTTGEALKLPGGGPVEAMKTVSLFLGVPIQYYVQVDFGTFVQMIDLIHGIDVYNDEDLRLKMEGGGQDVRRITCCGMRHLGGEAALAYARCRKPEQGCNDGDVGRAKRQQKVILAVRDKVFNARNFPMLMGNAAQLYNTFQAGIHTNMPLDDAIKLAATVSEIPLDRIQQGVIDDHMVNYGNVIAGGQNAAVLLPIPDKIRELRDQIFTVSGPAGPIAQGDAQTLMRQDEAKVQVTNNTYTAQLEQRTGNYLVSQGMNVVGIGNPTGASEQTVVIVHSPKLYTLRYLIQIGMISASNQIIFQPDATSPVDIEIRLGNDWVPKLPAGF